jgi:hypothetical protein
MDLDFQVIRAGPVGVTAGAALVDALGQVAHHRHAVADLLAQQHAAAAGLGALADHDLDRIGAAQVIGVHAVAAGQVLIDQRLGMPALFLGHAAVAGGGRGAGLGGATAQGLFRRAGQRAKAHARDGDGDVQVDRLLGETGAQPDVGGAFLAVAFQRVARDRRAQEQQVIEVRQVPLGAAAADVVDAGGRRAADFRVDGRGEGGRIARRGMGKIAHRLPQYAAALSMLKL